MGWHGEVEDGLKTAAKEVNQYPRNSLGWCIAALEWNRWALESTDDGNDWEDTGLPADQLPTNCEWVKGIGDDPPLIKIPAFDKMQILS